MFALALSAAATTKGCRVGPRPGPRAPVLPVRFCFNGFTSWQADIPNANGEWCPVKLMRQTQSSAKNCHAHCHARFRKGERLRPRHRHLVEESRAAVAAIAAQIQERSGADWFRLDIFLSKVAPPRINEISYPSRSGEDPRAWVRLLCAYRQGRFRAVAGKKIWRQVAAAASLSPTARLAPNQSVPRSRSSSELSTDHVGAEDRALFRAAKHALSRVY